MNILFAAQSGWGKSYNAQSWLEENIPNYETSLILDYSDEYRGLVKSGLCKWAIAGPDELAGWGVDHYRQLLAKNQHIVLCRHSRMTPEHWRAIAAKAIAAARRMKSSLTAIDEAHFVAPQSASVPAAIEGLATTGRGEGASSVWITQRLAKIEETVAAQCQARMLGGFESSADLNKVADIVEYPSDLHNPQAAPRTVPDEVAADDDNLCPLRKFTDDAGDTIGSEWIYSDNTGDRRRVDTRNVDMDSTHYGSQGKQLKMPDYG